MAKRDAYMRSNRNFLRSIVLSLFEWTLPETCNARILERDLLITGAAAIFWDDTLEMFVNTQITQRGNPDMYGIPKTYECRGLGYRRTMPSNRIATVYNSIGGLYGAKDNIVFFDLNALIEQYAGLLSDCDVGISNEISNSKHPAVLGVKDSKSQKSAKEAWRQASDGEPIVIVDEQFFGNVSTQVFPLPRDTHIADKQQAKQSIFQEFLYKIGVNSIAYEKSERLITAEADVSEQSVSLPLQNLLVPRLEACEKFYRLYGEKISVKPRTLNTKYLF